MDKKPIRHLTGGFFVIILNMADIRILLTGGGTGGHIYPLIAVAKKLPPDADVHYFGDPGYFAVYLEQAGIKIHKIAASKLRRYFSLLNFLDFFKFIWGFKQALWKVFWFMPDVAFSKGGPGALPVILVCRFYRIPIVIHESDAVPSLTTKISAKFAKKIELAFAQAREYFAAIKTKAEINVVGQPVREELLPTGDSAEAKKSLGLDPAKPAVLIIGGSQGAERINDFTLDNLNALLSKFQMIHAVGPGNQDEYKKEYDFLAKEMSPELTKGYVLAAYFDQNLKTVYDAADLIVSRAGAGAIFEIAAKGKPSILIPLPESANGHQEANAYAYSETGAAILLEEENLLETIFINEVIKILSDPALAAKMSEAAKKFYKADAADKIASDIISP